MTEEIAYSRFGMLSCRRQLPSLLWSLFKAASVVVVVLFVAARSAVIIVVVGVNLYFR